MMVTMDERVLGGFGRSMADTYEETVERIGL